MTDSSEQTIIAAIRAGEHDQYRWLVERYHRGLIQHLCNLMRDQQAAEDIAQEAFIQAYDKLAQYNPAYAFSTWLYKIADNLAFRQFKRQKRTLDIELLAEQIPDAGPSLPELADRSFAKEAVRQAIASLPLAYQQVVTLYYWDNVNYEEIAEITGRPIGTIRTWLHRAKQQLRKELYGQV